MKTNEPVFNVNDFRAALGRNLSIVCTLVCYIAAIIMLLQTAAGVIRVMTGDLPAFCVLVLLGITAGLSAMGAICDAISVGFGADWSGLFDKHEGENEHE